MTPTIVSELTETSFRITWDHDDSPNTTGRTLFLYEGSTSIKIYEIPDIPLAGSQLFSDLKPDVQYKAQIATSIEGSEVVALDTIFARTLPLPPPSEQPPINVPPQIAAKQTKTFANKIFLGIGLVLLFLGLLKVAISTNSDD